MKFLPSIILTAILFTFSACSDSDESKEEPNVPNPALDRIDFDAPDDMVAIEVSPEINKQVVGAGYDACAPYLSYKAIKAPIVDLQKLEALGDGYYNLFSDASSYSDIETFETADQMPFSIYANIKEDPWFCSDITHSSCFSFTYIATNFSCYIHRLLLMDHTIKKQSERVFSDEFLSDIETMKPTDIITKYGTHVITAVSTGWRIGSLYRTAAFPPLRIGGDHGPSAEMICQHAAALAMRKANLPINIQVSNDADYQKWHGDGALQVTVEGGNTSLLSANPTTDEFNAWMKTGCTPENGAILSFPDDPMPIYELIEKITADKDKATAVKKAFDQYVSANTLSVKKTAALLQSWENGQYKYSTTPTEYTEGGVCAIPLTNSNGLTTLYSVTKGNKSRLMTGENGVPIPGASLMLGYVYTSQAEGTVPLYEYECNGYYYYTLKESISSNTEHRWRKAGILGYVIPLTVE